MKKTGLLLLCLFAISFAFAQSEVKAPTYKHANWFVSATGGAQFFATKHYKEAGKKVHISPEVTVSVGKWFNHVWGAQLMYDGMSMKGVATDPSNPFITENLGGGFHKIKFDYAAGYINLLFNVNSAICPNSRRVWEAIIYGGPGFGRSWNDDFNKNSWTGSAGLINRFRLSPSFDANVNMNGKVYMRRFDQQDGGRKFSVAGGTTVGLTYKF